MVGYQFSPTVNNCNTNCDILHTGCHTPPGSQGMARKPAKRHFGTIAIEADDLRARGIPLNCLFAYFIFRWQRDYRKFRREGLIVRSDVVTDMYDYSKDKIANLHRQAIAFGCGVSSDGWIALTPFEGLLADRGGDADLGAILPDLQIRTWAGKVPKFLSHFPEPLGKVQEIPYYTLEVDTNYLPTSPAEDGVSDCHPNTYTSPRAETPIEEGFGGGPVSVSQAPTPGDSGANALTALAFEANHPLAVAQSLQESTLAPSWEDDVIEAQNAIVGHPRQKQLDGADVWKCVQTKEAANGPKNQGACGETGGCGMNEAQKNLKEALEDDAVEMLRGFFENLPDEDLPKVAEKTWRLLKNQDPGNPMTLNQWGIGPDDMRAIVAQAATDLAKKMLDPTQACAIIGKPRGLRTVLHVADCLARFIRTPLPTYTRQKAQALKESEARLLARPAQAPQVPAPSPALEPDAKEALKTALKEAWRRAFDAKIEPDEQDLRSVVEWLAQTAPAYPNLTEHELAGALLWGASKDSWVTSDYRRLRCRPELIFGRHPEAARGRPAWLKVGLDKVRARKKAQKEALLLPPPPPEQEPFVRHVPTVPFEEILAAASKSQSPGQWAASRLRRATPLPAGAPDPTLRVFGSTGAGGMGHLGPLFAADAKREAS